MSKLKYNVYLGKLYTTCEGTTDDVITVNTDRTPITNDQGHLVFMEGNEASSTFAQGQWKFFTKVID